MPLKPIVFNPTYSIFYYLNISEKFRAKIKFIGFIIEEEMEII